ncbi:hypothetical protein ACEN9X_24260 [Mucilaginibacter sp. Mucisp86]|uniref:hypothetical protein n=1 Tax=Mucilaginibacter sp. Mucisp86 TaxID=3243060 RepID=UPI0039B3E856
MMPTNIRKFIKASILIILALYSGNLCAQVALVQKTIDNLKSHRNFSYQSTSRVKEFFTSDTVTNQTENIILNAPEDKTLGYLYKTTTLYKADNLTLTSLYNGKNLITINPTDSSYRIDELQPVIVHNVLTDLNWIKDFIMRKPSKLTTSADTAINKIVCSHLIVNTRDTVVNKEHLYTYIHLFIGKTSEIPISIKRYSRSAGIGNGVTNFYAGDFFLITSLIRMRLAQMIWLFRMGFIKKRKR